jgi:hypothetical protein
MTLEEIQAAMAADAAFKETVEKAFAPPPAPPTPTPPPAPKKEDTPPPAPTDVQLPTNSTSPEVLNTLKELEVIKKAMLAQKQEMEDTIQSKKIADAFVSYDDKAMQYAKSMTKIKMAEGKDFAVAFKEASDDAKSIFTPRADLPSTRNSFTPQYKIDQKAIEADVLADVGNLVMGADNLSPEKRAEVAKKMLAEGFKSGSRK